MLRRTLVLSVSLLLLAGAGGASAQWFGANRTQCASPCTAAPAGSGPLFTVTGHGWGHGIGLSQYGAYGYAQHGWAWKPIVLHYFPGTTIGPAPVSRVRVLLATNKPSLQISSQSPIKVKDAAGETYALPAGTVKLGPGLKLKLNPEEPAAVLLPPVVFSPTLLPLSLGDRPYRGTLQVDVPNGKLRAINSVPLESYLYGVVPSEMPHTWAAEALKAQAVTARSYALAVRKTGAFDLFPDTRSQVYLGLSHEFPESNAAVDATAGQVVLYGGQVATTYFFSTSGGRTANVADVWGGSVPYLVSVPDPYDSISPHHDWGPVVFSGATLAKKLKVPGRVTDMRASLNSSGRVQTLTLVTAKGETTIPGSAVRSALGLRSTWFGIGMIGLTPPAAPDPISYGTATQLLGVARGVGQVSLEARPAGGAWQTLGAVAPGKDGSIAVAAKPLVTTDYRLSTGSAAAGSIRIQVAPRVRFYAQKSQTELRGFARPVLAGAAVAIQRANDAGAWATVSTTKVDANGDFTAPVVLSAGTYRARVAATKGLAPGMTPILRVVAP